MSRLVVAAALVAAGLTIASCTSAEVQAPTTTPVAAVAKTPTVTPAATVPPEKTLPTPTGLALGTYYSGLPRALRWQPYPDPDATFELQWRFNDVEIWQELGPAPAGSTKFGEGSGALTFHGNLATYCYRIRAIKARSVSAWSEESCTYIGAGEPHEKLRWAPPFRAPELARVDGAVKVSWDPVDPSFRDRLQLEVWRRDRNDPQYETIATVPASETQFMDPGAAPESCYRLRAVLADGVPSLSPESCLAASG